MTRTRKAIRKDEYLAAALACLLPQNKRDELRQAKVPVMPVAFCQRASMASRLPRRWR